ncbi:MAG: peroxiredoxin [Chthoniobacterales bacterium]
MKYQLLTFILFMGFFTFRTQANPVPIGSTAPKLTATNQDGATVSFGDVYAKGITLVYFYPKAETPGCTSESCSLRDAIVDLKAKNVTVLGVSEDSVKAQKRFKDRYNLPFELIADTDGKVAEAFGVPVTLGLASRQSFIIKDGKVAWTCLRVIPKEHTKEVQNALDKLKESGTN